MERIFVLVQMLDELGNPALVVKLVRAFLFVALVADGDANAFIEKSLFAQTLRELVKAELCGIENFRVRLESNFRSALARLSRLLKFGQRECRACIPVRRSCRRARFPASASRKES